MSDSDDSDFDIDAAKRKRNFNEHSDDDEIEEEDEEDEESEEEQPVSRQSRPSKQKKQRRKAFDMRGFLDEEAEVDEDDEEGSDDEADEDFAKIMNDHISRDDLNLEASAGHAARDLDSRRRLEEFITGQNEEEIERYYTEKYNNQDTFNNRFGEGEAMADSIVQQSHLPGIKDPNLWVIKCRMGEEKATVLSLMRKFTAMRTTDSPLLIKSAIAKEGLRGYIYIEAYRQNHVKDAIEGINALGMSRYKQTLVPIPEMTDVMKVVKETGKLKSGQWVRLKSGLYKDDLASVDYVEDAQNLVVLKLLPRIDYDRYKQTSRLQEGPADDPIARPKRFKRPPPAPLDRDKVKDRLQNDGPYTIFAGSRYDSDGFMHKDFRLNMVVSGGIRPTLTELERFKQTGDGSQLAIAASMVAKSSGAAGATSTTGGPGGSGQGALLVTHQFAPGDVVEVCDGDLRNLRGRITSVEGDKRIVVQPNHSDLKQPIPFTPAELTKFFSQGDHVKVLAGRYEGETGLVIRFEPSMAVVLSDHSLTQMKVAPKNLRLWQDSASSVNVTSHVQLLDLVKVDPQTVGIVVGVEKESISVLTVFGKLVELKANTALRRLNTDSRAGSRAPQAVDRNGNMIQAKDSVTLVEKPHAGMQGEVKHIYRSWLFVYCRTHLENAGIVVCKSRQVALVGAPTVPQAQQTGAGRGPAGAPPPGGQARQPRFAERKLFGKTARIVAGTLKGLTGIICDATARDVYIELHSQFRKVHVLRENVALLDESGRIMGSQYGTNTMTTPRIAPAQATTPLHGSQTPHAASMTPRPDATPLSNYFLPSMATPALRSGMDEAMTPSSGGYSWQTPSYDTSNRASHSDNEG